MYSKKKRGLLASAGALVTAVALALGGAAAASAAPIIPLPEPNDIGSLTIHKFHQPTQLGDPADGMEQNTDGLTAWNPTTDGAVSFTIWKVGGVDLSTNAGWQTAAAMDVAAAKAATSGGGTTLPIAANGTAVFDDLAIGLYYVEETVWPSGATPAAPFLVTVPITNARDIVGSGTEFAPEFPAGTTWLYDVHVYPKNAITSGQKTVNDTTSTNGGKSIKLGDNVEWTITGDIPKADPIDGYRITDVLDSRLALVTSGAGVAPALSLTGTTGVTLAETTDYVWSNTAGKLQVDFTTAGRAKLVTAWKADPAAQVKIVFNTTVLAVTSGVAGETNGVINNQATIYPNQAAIDWQEPTDPEDPTPPGQPPVTTVATTKVGNIVLQKLGKNDAALAGAEFQVFLSESAAQTQSNPLALAFDETGAALDPSPKSTFVSEADGRVLIPGLRYSDWADGLPQKPFCETAGDVVAGTCAQDKQTDTATGDTVDNPKFQYYWIVETKTVSGYELLAEPIRVVVNSPETSVTGATQVKNVPTNAGFELPLTGGMGTALLTIGGIAILATVLIVARRRQNADAAAE